MGDLSEVRYGTCRSILLVAIAVALLLHRGVAAAQTPRERAILLADEGSQRLETRDYAGAVEKFDAAFALVPVPVFALQAANALEKSGRLVDALARYRAAYEMKPAPDWSKIQHEARATARERHQQLAARTPRLVVVFAGAQAERVELDDRETSPDVLAAGVLVDPGEHRVVAHAGTKRAEQLVAVAEGQTRRIELVFASDQGSPPASAAPAPSSAPSDVVASGREPSSPTARTLGWVALGVGAAGIAVGGVSGLMAIGKKSDLDERCPDRSCPPPAWGDNDAYDRLRVISTIGLVVGAAGVVTGGVLLWTSPSASSTGAARLGLRAAPGRVTLAGEF